MPEPDLTFEAVTATEPRRACAKRRSLTFPLSIAAHLVALCALIVIPVLTSDALPEPAISAVRAFLVAPLAPPPPPPPPAGGLVAHVESTRAVPRAATFTAPIEIPQQVTPEASDLGIEGGGPGGAEGGVPGGVEGGVPGGVVGGVVGGLPEAPPTPQEPLRVGGAIKEPKKLKNVDPVYPPLAVRTGVQGVVILECTLSPNGKVVAVKVLRGIPLLDAAAIEAVKQWVYTPTLYNGVPVPVLLTVNVRFAL